MLSMDAYPDDLNFMDCNGVEADDLGDLFSANFYPQNTAAFIFDEHSPSSGVMGNDDLAQLPAPPSTTSAAHSNEFLDSNHHHHHDQQEDSHLNGIGFIESDVAKISQSQQHPDWSMTTKNDWQHGGMEANDYLLSNIPVDTPVTATDCAFAEETSTQSSNKNTVPDSQCGWGEQINQHVTSTNANSHSNLFANYSSVDDQKKGEIATQHLSVPDASSFVEVLDSNISNDNFIPSSMLAYHASSNTYDYEKHDVYRSYLLDHDYTSLRPYHEMPPQLPARRLQLPAALPRIRVKRRQPENAYRISSTSGAFYSTDSAPLMATTSFNNASTSGSENKNQMDYYLRAQEPQPVNSQPLASSAQAQPFRRRLQPSALRTSRNQMGNNYPATTTYSRSSVLIPTSSPAQGHQQQQPTAISQPPQNRQSQNDQNQLPDRPPVLLPQSTIRQPPMMRYTATGYANGVGSGGAIKFYEDPLELQRTNRKYRRQHQSIKALAGKHSMYCSTCRMRYFYPAAQIYKHIRWMTTAGGEGKAAPYFLCKVCGYDTQL